MKRRGRHTTIVLAVAVTLAALAVPAYGVSDRSESASAAANLAVAKARVAEFRKPVPDLQVTTPLKRIPKGKTIFYIQCSVPVCEEIRVGIAGAAKALGLKLRTVTHKDTPDTVQAAWQAAVAAKPAAVLASGNPREWFEDQLEALTSAKTPVITWSIPEGYRPGGGINANLLTGDDYYFYGMLMADYLAATSNGKANSIFFALPTFPVLELERQGFLAEWRKVCSKTCTLKVVSIDVTDLLAGNLPQVVISQLQANPKVDSLAFAFGGMLFGVPEALEGAGLADRVKAVSQAGGPLNFQFIEKGQVQVAELGLASEYLGWRAVDAAARALVGQPIGRPKARQLAKIVGHPDVLAGGLPLQILEKGDVKDPTKLWPGVANFKARYLKVWGVKK
jgi:ribose transport system substrate-binding protein